MVGPLVEDPDRFEAAHVRHEDVDDHQIEMIVFEGAQFDLASFGNRHPKMVSLEIDLDGHAHHRVVADNENMAQIFCPRLSFQFRRFNN